MRSPPPPPPAAERRAPLHLPTYLLYGENGAQARPEVLHIESIASRSRLHSWEIKPHRHETLFQLLFVSHGQVHATLDGRSTTLRAPVLVTVPPLAPHGFAFSHDVKGDVVTLLDAHLRRIVASEPALLRRLLEPRCGRLAPAHAARVREAQTALRREHSDPHEWRALAADAALASLLVTAARALPSGERGTGASEAGDAASRRPQSRAAEHVAAFRDWIEQHFREQPRMSACAAALGITPTQLNRVCQQVLGHSAQAVLHTRLLMEAQRDLLYTSMSIKQVALALGFSDAAYFTRFFEREAGVTPSAWREREKSAHPGPARRGR
jgi:AraC family transcriptional activator of pobA